MTKDDLEKRAKEIIVNKKSIPYVFGLFERKVSPPHLVAHITQSNNFGADNIVYKRKNIIQLELTTDYIDLELEEQIETKILFDTYWEKYETDIESEKIHNVSYFFEI